MGWVDELKALQTQNNDDAFVVAINNILKIDSFKKTRFPIRDLAVERRRTKFSQNVGYLPYLKQSQKADDFELFNLFDGFRWLYDESGGLTKLGQFPPQIKPFIFHV